MMTDRPAPAQALALTGALLATWDALHPLFDHWVPGRQGRGQQRRLRPSPGLPGRHARGPGSRRGRSHRPAHHDRHPAGLDQRSTAHASYTAGQLAGTVVLTRALGYRVPASALLAGSGINAITHLVIDKRQPLLWLAARAGKGGYVEHCTVVRHIDEDGTARAEDSGPGTAAFELDQALHRAVGAIAAVTTTWLTIRATKKGRA